ncbi:MAG: hypothetical protein H0X51_06730 [Parachlamydiaceae bacterium]|nr:hypothetical protein [Parachlamydiaceae bacterium]
MLPVQSIRLIPTVFYPLLKVSAVTLLVAAILYKLGTWLHARFQHSLKPIKLVPTLPTTLPTTPSPSSSLSSLDLRQPSASAQEKNLCWPETTQEEFEEIRKKLNEWIDPLPKTTSKYTLSQSFSRHEKLYDSLKTMPPTPFLKQLLAQEVLNFEALGPKVAQPNSDAMHNCVKYYQEKYNILIMRVTWKSDFFEGLLTLSKPMYMGVIFEFYRTMHAIPVLFHINHAGATSVIEAIIMDSTGITDPLITGLNNVKSELEKLNIPYYRLNYTNNAIQFPLSRRQTDESSCRIDALITLRNALLHLKYVKCQNGFEDFLTKELGKNKKGFDLLALPGSWVGNAQRTSRIPETGKALVYRDFFSKKAHKRDNPRTVVELRAKHIGKVTYELTMWLADKFTVPADPDFTLTTSDDESMTFVTWYCHKRVNKYMQDKGFLLARKVDNAHKDFVSTKEAKRLQLENTEAKGETKESKATS